MLVFLLALAADSTLLGSPWEIEDMGCDVPRAALDSNFTAISFSIGVCKGSDAFLNDDFSADFWGILFRFPIFFASSSISVKDP